MQQSISPSINSLVNLQLLSKSKAAKYLGIGKKKLEKLTSEGKIRFIEINGRKIYPIQALQEFIDSNLKIVNTITEEQAKSLSRFDTNISNKSKQTDPINYNSIIQRILQEKLNGYNYN